MKRALCVWALPKRDHLEIIMVHEKMLAMRRMTRTVKATGPLLWIISSRALPLAATGAAVESS
jgi:hypothetical protein